MTLTRRKTLALVGGGIVAAASAATGYAVTRLPETASLPWDIAGTYSEPRRRALSFALLAPNPHNRQPWMIDLGEKDVIKVFADTTRLLPETDPFNRQITIGLGCFLEVMRMAAAQDGYRVDLEVFPEGEQSEALDNRPVAHARFFKDPNIQPDPLFAHVMARRSLKEPYDTNRSVDPKLLTVLSEASSAGSMFGGSVTPSDVADLRVLSHEALRIEIETPRTYKESIDLFRIGHREIDANPDGIDFSGPMFETMRLTGLFSREKATDTESTTYKEGLKVVFANTDTAMGHIWLVSTSNTRLDQIRAGADWVRVNLAATGYGLGMQPLSQALQEFPEMAAHYEAIHKKIAPGGGTVQMFARIGYGPDVAPSPRWPLEEKLVQT